MNNTYINYGLPVSPGRKVMLVFAVIAGVATLMMQSFISGMLSSISIDRFLAMQFSWNLANFNANLTALGSGAEAYTSHLWYDLIYPLAYSTFLYCTLFMLLTPKPRGFNLLAAYRRAWALERFRRLRSARGLAVFPIIGGLADLVENGVTIFLMGNESARTDPMVLLGFCAAMTKWVFIILTGFVAIYAMIVQWLAKHKRNA